MAFAWRGSHPDKGIKELQGHLLGMALTATYLVAGVGHQQNGPRRHWGPVSFGNC